LQGIAEENAILMRECAMASLTSLELSMDSDADGPTLHPEMMTNVPQDIPNTASEFLSTVNETELERYQRMRQEAGTDAEASATPPPDLDTPRPGALSRALRVRSSCALYALPPAVSPVWPMAAARPVIHLLQAICITPQPVRFCAFAWQRAPAAAAAGVR
jgi:hypothetical protein